MSTTTRFERAAGVTLAARLRERRRFIQVLAGPRQVGKTTLVTQVLERLALPHRYASADDPGLRGAGWIEAQWGDARALAADHGRGGATLVLDEVQKLPEWSATVKRLWDEDTRRHVPLRVVLLGSAPLLIQHKTTSGLSESLAGRFETLRLAHWSWPEMRDAFGFTLNQFLFFGGYPGAAPLIGDEPRWRRYVQESLAETTVSRDVLLLSRVDKPALLRQLYALGVAYSGQVVSYTKMLGQLQDAGNVTTLVHYAELLDGAGLLRALGRFSGAAHRTRGSIPKWQVLNTALMSAASAMTLAEARADREWWGRLVESAVGAHLANGAADADAQLHYWRERNREVDFVLSRRRRTVAIEVKSGRAPRIHAGLEAFRSAHRADRVMIVGGDGTPLDEFLGTPVSKLLAT
jgi:predicted AAA+ superfamily ATPase